MHVDGSADVDSITSSVQSDREATTTAGEDGSSPLSRAMSKHDNFAHLEVNTEAEINHWVWCTRSIRISAASQPIRLILGRGESCGPPLAAC